MLAARIAALQQATRPRKVATVAQPLNDAQTDALVAKRIGFGQDAGPEPSGVIAPERRLVMPQQVDTRPQTAQSPELPVMPAPTGLPDVSNQVAAQERYKAFLPQQQPQTQAYNQAVATDGTKERHGFKDKVLHWLASLGKGFVMGGPIGAAVGAFSPNTIDRAIHRNYTLPRLERQMQIEQGQGQQRTNNLFKTADITGYDPNGNLTQEAQEKLLRQRSLDDNRMRADEDRNARISGDTERRRETERQHKEENAKAAVLAASKLRRPVPPEAVAGTSLASYAGTVPPPEERNVQVFESDQGLMERDPITGAWKPAQGPGGALRKPVKPDWHEKTFERQDAREAKRDEQTRQAQERKDYSEYQKAHATAIKADKAVAKFQGALDAANKSKDEKAREAIPFYEEQLRQAQADSDDAWFEARQASETMKTVHGYEQGVQDGKYPYVKPPARARGAAAGAHPSIGKIMQMSDGRKIKVKRVEGGQVTDYDVIP